MKRLIAGLLISTGMASVAAAATMTSRNPSGGCSEGAVVGSYFVDDRAIVPSVSLPRSIAKSELTSVKSSMVNGPVSLEVTRGIAYHSRRTAPYPHGVPTISLSYYYSAKISYDLPNAPIPSAFGWKTPGNTGLKAQLLVNGRPLEDVSLNPRCLHCEPGPLSAEIPSGSELIGEMTADTPIEVSIAVHDDKGNWDSKFGANYRFCVSVLPDWNPVTF